MIKRRRNLSVINILWCKWLRTRFWGRSSEKRMQKLFSFRNTSAKWLQLLRLKAMAKCKNLQARTCKPKHNEAAQCYKQMPHKYFPTWTFRKSTRRSNSLSKVNISEPRSKSDNKSKRTPNWAILISSSYRGKITPGKWKALRSAKIILKSYPDPRVHESCNTGQARALLPEAAALEEGHVNSKTRFHLKWTWTKSAKNTTHRIFQIQSLRFAAVSGKWKKKWCSKLKKWSKKSFSNRLRIYRKSKKDFWAILTKSRSRSKLFRPKLKWWLKTIKVW